MTVRWSNLPIRCATCHHGPASHIGGYGGCQRDCTCARYVDTADVQASMDRHPAGKGLAS